MEAYWSKRRRFLPKWILEYTNGLFFDLIGPAAGNSGGGVSMRENFRNIYFAFLFSLFIKAQ